MSQKLKDVLLCLIFSTLVVGGMVFLLKVDGKKHDEERAKMEQATVRIEPTHRFNTGPDAETYYVVEEIEIDGQAYLVLVDSANSARCIIPKSKPVSPP